MDVRGLGREVESVSSAYAESLGIERNDDWFILKLHEEMGELTQAYLMRSGRARTKGLTTAELDEAFRAELADVLAHVLLLAARFDIDVERAIARKWLVRKPDPPAAGHPEDAGSPPRP